ncbi:hypothetical protein GCM10023334_085850 [Nonomuraea thailandensis]
MGQAPQRQVGSVQQDRRAGPLGKLRGVSDVVVVGVGGQDGEHVAACYEVDDGLDVMRGIEDHAFGVVSEHPHVVVHVERLPAEAEGS